MQYGLPEGVPAVRAEPLPLWSDLSVRREVNRDEARSPMTHPAPPPYYGREVPTKAGCAKVIAFWVVSVFAMFGLIGLLLGWWRARHGGP
jgi:hypothetical protein